MCDPTTWCEKVLHSQHFKPPLSLEKSFIDRLPQIWARAQRVIDNYNCSYICDGRQGYGTRGSLRGAVWSGVRLFGRADWSCLFRGDAQKLLIGVTTAAGTSQLEGEFSNDRRCCYSMSGLEGELEPSFSTGPTALQVHGAPY